MTLPPELPTGPMDPVPARPGALDEVRAAARARRNRRSAVLGGVASVLLLAIALPLALQGDDDRPQQLQTADDDGGTDVPGTTSTTDAVVDEGTDDPPETTTTTREVLEGIEEWPPVERGYRINDPSVLVGRAAGPDGRPLQGIHVYTGPAGGIRGIPRPVTSTDDEGWYQIPCPTTAVVLTGAQLSTFAGLLDADQNFAPTVVTMPDGTPLHEMCGTGGVVGMQLPYGGVIEGVVRGLGEPQTGYTYIGGLMAGFDLPWPTAGDCQGVPSCYFNEGFIRPDGTFRIIGLPPGAISLYREATHPDDVDSQKPPEYVTDVVQVRSGEITRVELQGPPPYPPEPEP